MYESGWTFNATEIAYDSLPFTQPSGSSPYIIFTTLLAERRSNTVYFYTRILSSSSLHIRAMLRYTHTTIYKKRSGHLEINWAPKP